MMKTAKYTVKEGNGRMVNGIRAGMLLFRQKFCSHERVISP